jgi:tetratricopeptide (TPR) repeat protein
VLQGEELQERESAKVGIEAGLAELLLLRNRFTEAEPLFRRQLERDPDNVDVRGNLAATLVGLGRAEEARVIYTSLLSETGLEVTQLFNLGVALFRADDFGAAARAFQRLTELQPESRDAWFNYANSLFAAQEWRTLASVGDRLLELDPLNENAGLITARAHLELGDQPAALRGVERVRGAPAYLEGLSLRRGMDEATVVGLMVGNRAEAGTPIQLRFTFYRNREVLGSTSLSIPAPAEGASEPFQVTMRVAASSYSYQVLP